MSYIAIQNIVLVQMPQEWDTDAARRAKAGIPDPIRFREKWRMAVVHIRRVRKAGVQLTAVVADADDGSNAAFRRGLERLGLRYGVAIRGALTLWTAGARRTRTATALAAAIPDADWVREIMAVLDVVSQRNLLHLIASFQRNPPLRR